MAAVANRTVLPRPLLVFGVPIAGLLLTALFIYVGFPYDKLGDKIASEIHRRAGVRVDFQDIAASPHLAGLGLEATGVRATLADGRSYRLERAMLRPAWSLAWFRGIPAIYAEVESELGNAAGTLLVGGAGGWDGELSQVAIGRLPIPAIEAFGALDGRLDASVDIELAETGPFGHVEFTVSDGSVGLARFPMDIPFETLTGELVFGDQAMIEVKRLDLAGPMLTASLKGSVLDGPSFAQAPLRLEAELTAEPNLRPAMQSAGLRLDRNGSAKLRFTGTVGEPVFR